MDRELQAWGTLDAGPYRGQPVVTVKLCVEGGGDSKVLRSQCRKGFQSFFEKAGLAGKMPSVVTCGSRGNAYRDFEAARGAGQDAILLVDAEGPVTAMGTWEHLKAQDNWNRPAKATADECHLMVQVMESWFLADPEALQSFYGQGFRPQSLRANPNTEEVFKQDVFIVSTLQLAQRRRVATTRGGTATRSLGDWTRPRSRRRRRMQAD